MKMRVIEAFIRRAAMVNDRFVLKGSAVTRQFLLDCNGESTRRVDDLDWVAIDPLDRTKLDRWASAVTETECGDGVSFSSFTDDSFWNSLDYVESEDFPTVSTDLVARIGEEEFIVGLDVSFGLPINASMNGLRYQCVDGAIIHVPLAISLETQIAWKLHQTLLRMRLKDIYDIIRLLEKNEIRPIVVVENLQKEATLYPVNLLDLAFVVENRLQEHPQFPRQSESHRLMPYSEPSLGEVWDLWRHGITLPRVGFFEQANGWQEIVTNEAEIPSTLEEFVEGLASALESSGLTSAFRTAGWT